jgi:hypothetical protein
VSHSKCDEIQYGCLALGFYVSIWSETRQASCLNSEMTQVSGLSLLFFPDVSHRIWILKSGYLMDQLCYGIEFNSVFEDSLKSSMY